MPYTYAGEFADAVFNTSGRPLKSAAITVKTAGGALATLYTDRTKTATVANPVSTDSYGNLRFFADPGPYQLEAAAGPLGGVLALVAVDPAEAVAGGGGGGGAPTGVAGGSLAGTYPNPTIADGAVTAAKVAADVATQAELDAEAAARAAADALSVPLAQKGAANGVATLDSGSKVPAAQLPSITISDFLGTVASQAAMLALSGQRGDWAIRSDTSTTWMLIGDDATQLANWKQLATPADAVSSVNGRTGAVTGLAEATDVTAEAAARAAATALLLAKAANLSDVANAATARTNLGLGTAATAASTDFEAAGAVAAEAALRATGDTTRVPNNQTADYTLVLGDAGKVIEINAATGKNVTVPPNSAVAYPVNTIVWVQQLGAGAATAVAGAGVTLVGASLVTSGVGSGLLLRKTATNTWVVQATSSATSGAADTLSAHGNTGTTETFDVSVATVHTATLDANCTVTFAGAVNGTPASMTLIFTQDATGSRTVTWPATVLWDGATAPTLSATPGAKSVFAFLTTDGGATWIPSVGGLDLRVLTVPGAPTGAAATAGDAQAIVTWSAPASNGGTAVTGYVVTPYIAGVAQTTTTVGNVLTATVTGLTNGTAYTFKVAAINAIGTGSQSSATSAVTPTSAFDPSTVTGIKHWLKADALALSDGAAVSSWTDSSTAALNATQATGAKQPTYKTGILNGKPVVRFVAANAQTLDTASPVCVDTDDYAHFVVASTVSGAVVDCAFYNGSKASNGRGVFPSSGSGTTGKVAVLQGGAAWQDSTTNTPTAATIYCFRRAAGTTRLFANGVELSIGSNTAGSGATPTVKTSIGSDGSTGYHDGDIAEELSYDQAVSIANMNNIGQYLATKYGMSWTTIT